MKRVLIALLVIFGLNITCLSAYATVIDFEEISLPYSGNSLDSQGFNFFNDCATTSLCISHRDPTSPYNADPGGVTFTHEFSRSTTTLTRIGGDAFDLISIDFADYLNNFTSQTIHLIGTYAAGGTISKTIALSPLLGLETFLFNWNDLSQVTWIETSSNWLQLDNVTVTKIAKVANKALLAKVAAPASLSLMVLGLMGLALSRKRRV